MATNLTVKAEDRPGAMAEVGEALGAAGVNINGGCAVTSGGEGWMHVLVDDAAGARAAIEGAGYSVESEREAVVTVVEDVPGALGAAARKLADAGANIELFYVATDMKLVFVVDDTGAAQAAL